MLHVKDPTCLKIESGNLVKKNQKVAAISFLSSSGRFLKLNTIFSQFRLEIHSNRQKQVVKQVL